MEYDEIKELIIGTPPMNRSNMIRKYGIKEDILSYTSYLDEYYDNPSVQQRIWHIEEDNKNIILCHVCNKNPAKFGRVEIRENGKRIGETRGYTPCSTKCSKEYRDKRSAENKSLARENFIKSSIEKYGVDHPMKVKEIYNKTDDSLRVNGIHQFQTEKFKEKFKKTSLKNYGTDHPMKNEGFMETMRETMRERYNVTHNSRIKKLIEKKKADTLKRWEDVLSEDYEIIEYDNSIKQYNIKHKLCDNTEWYYNRYVKSRIFNGDFDICKKCYPGDNSISHVQKEVYNFIKSVYGGKVVLSDREILDGKELDIYLPEENLAFEYNGLYWHSELFKKRSYHKNKTEDCKNKNIRLIHIWEDVWLHKKDIMKSIITGLLGKNMRIYARKCTIKKVDNKDAKILTDANHIQGHIPSKYIYGIYHNDELLQIMSFTFISGRYELYRMCTKRGYSVVGGASKLFKHFIKENNPKEIITYTDISIFDGRVYENMGMKLSHITSPSHFYFDIKDKKRVHRRNFQKKKLVKMGFDENKTGNEICAELGLLRIYDCGNSVYKWNPK